MACVLGLCPMRVLCEGTGGSVPLGFEKGWAGDWRRSLGNTRGVLLGHLSVHVGVRHVL